MRHAYAYTPLVPLPNLRRTLKHGGPADGGPAASRLAKSQITGNIKDDILGRAALSGLRWDALALSN